MCKADVKHQTKILNLGPQSSQWLQSVGVRSPEDLKKIGAVEAYKRVKTMYPDRVSLNLLYALQGALLNKHWWLIAADMREHLKKQLLEE